MLELLAADVRAAGARSLGGGLARAAGTTALQAVLLHRLAHAAGRVSPALGSFVKWLNHVLTGADIAADARIGPGLRLAHPSGVVIGPGVRIGARAVIAQHVTLGAQGGEPWLGDDVFVAAGAVLLGPIRLGDGARVAANSVVMRDVPAGRTAAGAPATVRGVAGAS